MRGFLDGWDYDERDPFFGLRALLKYLFIDHTTVQDFILPRVLLKC